MPQVKKDQHRYTHAQFISECAKHGIAIHRITRNHVYVPKDVSGTPKIDGMRAIHGLDHNLSSLNRSNMDELKQAILSKLKIQSIKSIRSMTGMGLKESKDLYELREDKWRTQLKRGLAISLR